MILFVKEAKITLGAAKRQKIVTERKFNGTGGSRWSFLTILGLINVNISISIDSPNTFSFVCFATSSVTCNTCNDAILGIHAGNGFRANKAKGRLAMDSNLRLVQDYG